MRAQVCRAPSRRAPHSPAPADQHLLRLAVAQLELAVDQPARALILDASDHDRQQRMPALRL